MKLDEEAREVGLKIKEKNTKILAQIRKVTEMSQTVLWVARY